MHISSQLALWSALLITLPIAACSPEAPRVPRRLMPSAEAPASAKRSAGDAVSTMPVPETFSPGQPQAELRVRIKFPAGATSATESGTLSSGGVARYLLAGEAGEAISVAVTSSQPPVVLSITGTDGTEILAVSDFAQSWEGELPTTQDYQLDLNAPTEFVSEYTLTVTKSK